MSSLTCGWGPSQQQPIATRAGSPVVTLPLRMTASEALAFMSGLDMDQHRLKSLSGTDVRYLISYFLRKMSLIAWIVVNISFSNSATTAMVNKLQRGILWYCTWFLIHLHFSVEESSLGTLDYFLWQHGWQPRARLKRAPKTTPASAWLAYSMQNLPTPNTELEEMFVLGRM